MLLVVADLSAVDLFAGAGGATQGLRDAGYGVVAAVENNPAACRTFQANHSRSTLLDTRDVTQILPSKFAAALHLKGRIDLLTACPPCQPFSTLGTGSHRDKRNALVDVIARFVEALEPRAVLVENVPGLAMQPKLRRLVKALRERYDVGQYIVQATNFGVPQSRRRMIIVALESGLGTSLPGRLHEALPPSFDRGPRTSGEIFDLTSKLTPAADPLHVARRLRELSARRLRATTPGGGRNELPDELMLECHRKIGAGEATTIYGRIDPSKPAPTMTTRCTSPSCGRFGHPSEPRGLTLREAALLQTFPPRYIFEGTYGDKERQIGNAVPPRLAEGLGLVVGQMLCPEGGA